MQKMHQLAENSAFIGELPKGCKFCGPGQKMVLLITGKCKCRCFYCPLSFRKRGKDTIYANELKVRNLTDIINEAKAISAKGTGITGGDPLSKPDRTLKAIKLLKETFGVDHHIHLYTAGKFDPKFISKLASSGLDELRFHPPVITWDRPTNKFIALVTEAIKTNMVIGSEIPVLPGYEKKIVKYAKTLDLLNVNFLNLNELEFSESNWENLKKHGYRQKNELANTVFGSETLGIKILRDLSKEPDFNLNVHYCSAQFKDRQQLTNRLKRRARNVKMPYFILTDDGTFLIGIIEPIALEDLQELIVVKKYLHDCYAVPEKLMHLNKYLHRLEVAPWVLERLKNELSEDLRFRCFIVEEYPTADRLEVEKIPINEFK